MGRGNYKKRNTCPPSVKEEKMEEQTQILYIEDLPEPLYKVQVTHPSLRRRSTPEIAENVIGVITDRGIYTITNERNGWGQLEDGSWIMLQYTEKISE